MEYENIRAARFLSRPNRFVAIVELDGEETVCHVKNTGRCRELLVPGATVYVQERRTGNRKTPFDLIAVEKGHLLINMDSQAPNPVFREYAEGGRFTEGLTLLQPEVRRGDSRLDFYYEAGSRRGFAEVKGVTLEQDGVALFPDAPTQRGVRHLRELIACREAGLEAWAVFIIQMRGAVRFEPNRATHPEFAETLLEAAGRGVGILALECLVTPGSISVLGPVDVRL